MDDDPNAASSAGKRHFRWTLRRAEDGLQVLNGQWDGLWWVDFIIVTITITVIILLVFWWVYGKWM